MVVQAIDHYELLQKLGEGGMGVVYRARDTRLGRHVALKFVKARVARNWETEARAIAALNHPHIAMLYDVGEHDGAPYLAMELVDGKPLNGPYSVKQATGYAIQIADALTAAHAAGIVHRDLKPANILVTESDSIKLLDFGLAKLADGSQSPDAACTQSMTISGTPGYVAPEQLDGKPADARGDIFAFGCVLYELLSGKRAFSSDSVSGALAATAVAEPAPLDDAPQELQTLIRRCLRKDPSRRLQHIADVRVMLEDFADRQTAVERPPAPRSPRGVVRLVAFAVALLAVLAVAVWTWTVVRSVSRSPAMVVRSSISLSPFGLALTNPGIAISPDGRTVVFAARAAGQPSRLYARRLDEWEPRALSGTDGAFAPFFSPDGEWVAFSLANKGFLKVPVEGGSPQPIADLGGVRGGAWAEDGRIIFGRWPQTGLWEIPAGAGAPRRLTRTAEDAVAVHHIWPDLLPGAEALLFTVVREGHPCIAALSLATGDIRILIDPGHHARYLPPGQLVYQSEEHLYSVAFDLERLKTAGSARVVVPNIGNKGVSSAYDYAVSRNGTLAYVPADARLSVLVWRDRQGNRSPANFLPRRYSAPALSPDGKRLAVSVTDAGRSVWAGSIDGEPLARRTFGSDDVGSVFTPDGKRIVFTSGSKGRYNLFWVPADGSGPAERLTDSPQAQKSTAFAPLGNILLFNTAFDATGLDIYQLDLDRGRVARPYIQTPFEELESSFSPDGRWVAYHSNESGRWEVYVQPYPGPGAKTQISTGGGQNAVWNPRGGELFYQSPTAMMSVQMANGLPVGAPKALFLHSFGTDTGRLSWDVAPDGQRFLAVEAAPGSGTPSQINVVSNWVQELRARGGSRF